MTGIYNRGGFTIILLRLLWSFEREGGGEGRKGGMERSRVGGNWFFPMLYMCICNFVNCMLLIIFCFKFCRFALWDSCREIWYVASYCTYGQRECVRERERERDLVLSRPMASHLLRQGMTK